MQGKHSKAHVSSRFMMSVMKNGDQKMYLAFRVT